jgi:apolipoprotein N-acyltransferase
MLRATNTGVSAIIGPRGEVLARSPQFKTDLLRGDVVPRAGATPYVEWGDWLAAGLAALLLLLAVLLRRRA